MARRRSTPARGKAPAAAGSRRARSKTSSAPAAQAEVVEEEGGEGMDTGVAVMTTIMLVAAFLYVDALRGGYGEGMFF